MHWRHRYLMMSLYHVSDFAAWIAPIARAQADKIYHARTVRMDLGKIFGGPGFDRVEDAADYDDLRRSHMASGKKLWFVGGKGYAEYGPYSLSEMTHMSFIGKLKRTHMCRMIDGRGWELASECEFVSDIFAKNNSPDASELDC